MHQRPALNLLLYWETTKNPRIFYDLERHQSARVRACRLLQTWVSEFKSLTLCTTLLCRHNCWYGSSLWSCPLDVIRVFTQCSAISKKLLLKHHVPTNKWARPIRKPSLHPHHTVNTFPSYELAPIHFATLTEAPPPTKKFHLPSGKRSKVCLRDSNMKSANPTSKSPPPPINRAMHGATTECPHSRMWPKYADATLGNVSPLRKVREPCAHVSQAEQNQAIGQKNNDNSHHHLALKRHASISRPTCVWSRSSFLCINCKHAQHSQPEKLINSHTVAY